MSADGPECQKFGVMQKSAAKWAATGMPLRLRAFAGAKLLGFAEQPARANDPKRMKGNQSLSQAFSALHALRDARSSRNATLASFVAML